MHSKTPSAPVLPGAITADRGEKKRQRERDREREKEGGRRREGRREKGERKNNARQQLLPNKKKGIGRIKRLETS